MLRSMTRTMIRSSTTSARPMRTLSSSRVIRPWKGPSMIEANGDYRSEAWLEEDIGGPLYENQKSLPRLPVPSIADTVQRFLPTAMPLASPEEVPAFVDAVQKFPEQAAHLHERLLKRADEYHDSSWLQHWWNTAGYLQVRDPVVINVSYFFHFKDDPSSRSSNIKRGAALLTAAALFRKQVATGQLPAERIGKNKTPLCSAAFKYMFHACRIPKEHQDAYRIYDPALHNHVIVARKGHFFAVDFVDPITAEPYPVPILEQALEECIRQADALEGYPQLGWLTGNDRDKCAKAREALLKTGGPAIQEALTVLESGALLLCLDDESPVSRNQCGRIFWHGSAENRWFDKSLQFIVTNNGKAGYLGEHSMMDGMPVLGLADIITKLSYKEAAERSSTLSESPKVNVRPIFADALRNTNDIDQHLEEGKRDFSELIGKHSLSNLTFQGYGSNFIKKAGFSPDAFVQMAMQLGTYRLWGQQAGTYEATQVRPYLHGRTETTRTVSTESAAFVKRMGFIPHLDEYDNVAREEKAALLHNAVAAHVKYMGLAAKGQGVDRHFFGLSMIAEEGESLPDLYSNPVFQRSKRWRVSTSHLTHPRFENWGYGEVYPDGVGLSYSIHPNHCVFNVTALSEYGWTDDLCHHIEEALLEMRNVVEIAELPASKL